MSTACERLWALRTLYGIVAVHEPPTRLSGTLIHTCLAYHYAERLPVVPTWYVERPLHVALEADGRGSPASVRAALEVYEAFRLRFAGCTWQAVAVEEEFTATIGEIDPRPVASAIDDEVVSCRTDLVVRVNGDLWIVDHKSTGGTYGRERLDSWKDDGEWRLNFQIMLNLHILRAPANVARLGGVVRGFVVQRIKQRPPYDFDRNVVQIPAMAYADAAGLTRSLVEKEAQIRQRIASGEKPVPNFGMCWGRYGKCDYHDICASGSDEERNAIMSSSYKSVLPIVAG